MSQTKNYHIIEAVYVGATNFRGSRVKIHSARFKKTRLIPYDHSARDILEIAEAYLKEKGIKVIGHGEATRGYYLVSETFKEI